MSRVTSQTGTRTLGSTELTAAVRERLLGGEPAALWQDGDARVMILAEPLEANVHETGIVVSAPLEADEAKGTVSVALALASGKERPDLVAAAEERVEGEPALAARWGRVLQEAIFAVLVELLEEAARAEGAKPVGVRVRDGVLELAIEEPEER